MKRIRVIVLTAFSVLLPLLGLNAAPTFTIQGGTLTAVELNGDSEIIIPDGVTVITDYAFRDCVSLTSLIIPASITGIGGAAFYGCSNLSHITFIGDKLSLGSENLGYIAQNCVIDSNGHYNGTYYDSSSNVRWTINDGWLTGVELNGETRITIPSVVTSIGNAFQGRWELKNVTIPSSVMTIVNAAFDGCINLESIEFKGNAPTCNSLFYHDTPDHCEVIVQRDSTGWGVGEGELWRGLVLRYASNVEWIINDYGDLQGANLNGETDIRIPNGVTRIMPLAFGGQNELTSVTIPNSVTFIESDAFANCRNLTNVTIGTGMERIDHEAFRGCDALTSFVVSYDNHFFMSAEGLLLTKDGGEIVAVPEGSETVTIPSSVTDINPLAFCGCNRLTAFIVSESNPRYKSIMGLLLSRDETTLAAVPRSLTEVSIPGSVTRIGDWAFSGCRRLTCLTIPDNVTTIGTGAFHDCSGMADANGFVVIRNVLYSYHGTADVVRIPDCVTAIDASAFSSCRWLTSVTIPNSVMSIGNSAFSDCSCLSFALLPSLLRVSVSRNNQFRNCVSDLRVVFYEGSIDEIEWIAVSFDANGGMIDTLPMNVLKGQSIDAVGDLPSPSRLHYRFLGWFTEAYGGEQVTEETILYENVTLYAHWEPPTTIPVAGGGSLTVADGVLLNAYLYGATKVTIPSSVTSIADYAFANCLELTNLTIPDSVTNIGHNAFYCCSELSSVTIPQYVCANGMSTVFPSAYQSITNVVISENVTNIECLAFGGCSGLTSVIIPKSVTSIGRFAFYGCKNLSLAFVPSRLNGSVSTDNQFIRCASDFQIAFYEDSDWVTVTFNANGGEVDHLSINAINGYSIGNLPIPSRPGYTFLGWFTDAESGDQVESKKIVNGDVTLFAHWEKLPVYLWLFAIVETDSRDAILIIDGDTASSSAAFPVQQNADGSFIANIVFRVKDGYELDTVTTNGAMVIEASGRKDDWTFNINLSDSDLHAFTVVASARLENYGVVAEKATCERTAGGYTLTAKDGETLFEGDIALTAVLDGAIVDTTKGYDVKIADDGKSATVRLKKPAFGAAVVAVDGRPSTPDGSDPTGALVVVDENELASIPVAMDDEEVGALPVAAVPGLYYQAAWGDNLDSLTTGTTVQATTDTLYLGVIKQMGTSGFYKVTVKEQ